MVLSSCPSSPSAELVAKAEEIHRVLSSPEVDVWKLRELALTKGGLVDDAIRKKVWPILVGIDDANLNQVSKAKRPRGREPVATGAPSRPPPPTRPPPPPPPPPTSLPTLPPVAPVVTEAREDDYSVISTAASVKSMASQVTTVTSHTAPVGVALKCQDTTATSHTSPVDVALKCQDEAQVARDVARCTWHLLTGSQRVQRLQMEFKRNKKVARHIQRKQDKLGSLICDTLVSSYNTPQPLRYYQGYHDVACIVLSTLQDRNLASRVLLQISFSHLRDSCNADFENLQTALHLSLLPMLQVLDPALYHKLHLVDMTPYFCLSWIITWFSHDVRDTALVKRLFDAFLASHAMFPTYMAVAMLICNRNEILDCENDFSLLHQCLCGLPKNSSSVGWKYRPGEGYVTDEEHGGTTVSTTSSIGTADFLLIAAAEEAEHQDSSGALSAVAPSTLLSSISSMAAPSVTFDELILEAIGIMKQIPPSHIVRLRQKNIRSSWFSRIPPPIPTTLLPSRQQLPRMLQEPPYWAVRKFSARSLAAAAAARHRRQGEKRLRSISRSPSGETMIKDEERLEVQDYLRDHAGNLAVIAAGYGSGPMRSNKRALGAVVAVAVVLLAVGLAYSQQQQRELQAREQVTSEANEILAVSSRVFEQSDMKNESVCNISGIVSDADMDSVVLRQLEAPLLDTMTNDNPQSRQVPRISENQVALSLSTQLAAHSYYLAGASHYMVVFAAIELVIRQESRQVQTLFSIAYSVVKPLLFRAVSVLNTDFEEEFQVRWAPFQEKASKNIRSLAAQIGNSAAGRQMRQWFRLVAASPVAQKIFESSVSSLVGASFTSLYT